MTSIGSIQDMYRFLIIGGVIMVVLIAFYVLMVMMKNKNKKSSLDLNIGMSALDVLEMKKKGLLTEEEAKAVRAAVARRTKERLEQMNNEPSLGPKTAHAAQSELLAELDRIKAEREADAAGTKEE